MLNYEDANGRNQRSVENHIPMSSALVYLPDSSIIKTPQSYRQVIFYTLMTFAPSFRYIYLIGRPKSREHFHAACLLGISNARLSTLAKRTQTVRQLM